MKQDKRKLIAKYVNDCLNKEEQYGSWWKKHKNKVIKYDQESAFIFNSDYLLILYINRISIAIEDDGFFYLNDKLDNDFDLSFGSGFNKLLKKLDDYVKKNGIPFHFIYNSSYNLDRPVFSENPCGYALGFDLDENFVKNWREEKNKRDRN